MRYFCIIQNPKLLTNWNKYTVEIESQITFMTGLGFLSDYLRFVNPVLRHPNQKLRNKKPKML